MRAMKVRKVVLVAKYQDDIRYGMLRSIQCSCMRRMSVRKDMGRLSFRLYNTRRESFV